MASPCPFRSIHGDRVAVASGASAGLLDLAADLDLGHLNEDELLGMDDKQTYVRKEQTRILKASRFFSATWVRKKLLASSLAMRPSLRIMGAFFQSARRYDIGQLAASSS